MSRYCWTRVSIDGVDAFGLASAWPGADRFDIPATLETFSAGALTFDLLTALVMFTSSAYCMKRWFGKRGSILQYSLGFLLLMPLSIAIIFGIRYLQEPPRGWYIPLEPFLLLGITCTVYVLALLIARLGYALRNAKSAERRALQ